jgi:hypothetical protein
MTAVVIDGLESLRRKLAKTAEPAAIKEALRNEAEAIAAEARARAPGEVADTVEIVDESRGLKLAYAIGTADPAGRFIELGTARRPATPWLWPAFRTRSPGIKRRLATLIAAGFRTRFGAV